MMTSSTLEEIPSGTEIFIDAPIFIYHYTQVSKDCTIFLKRCARREIRGVTSILVLTEVNHRLMMIEAVKKGLISPGNSAKKLRAKPEIVQELHLHHEQVANIPRMGIEIEPLEDRLLQHAVTVREKYGFLTNDSLIAATVEELEIEALASGDQDFIRMEGIELYRPSDMDDVRGGVGQASPADSRTQTANASGGA